MEEVLNKQAIQQKLSQLGNFDLSFLEQSWVIFCKILHPGGQILVELKMALARIKDGETSALSFPVTVYVCVCRPWRLKEKINRFSLRNTSMWL